MPDGVLNLRKPRGPTSHDIVDRVRALTSVRRVGHAGTLDPLATGVLVICIGQATRISEYLMAGQKTYRARLRLGVTTDTHDAEGDIVAEAPVDVSHAQVQAALARFQGTITQVPPMYSALKHKGTSLHKLARQGIEIHRPPRQVEIFHLELTAWEPPDCTLEMRCSPGTYVRVLAHDLGQVLSCGAHITALTRLASGEFRLEDAITLEELAHAAKQKRWPDLLQPMDLALAHFPRLEMDAHAARQLCSGQAISSASVVAVDAGQPAATTSLGRAYGPDGTFLALAAYDPAADVWRPRKVFRSHRSERQQAPFEGPRC